MNPINPIFFLTLYQLQGEPTGNEASEVEEESIQDEEGSEEEEDSFHDEKGSADATDNVEAHSISGEYDC